MQKFELAIGEPPHQISGAVDPLLDIEIGCERDESRFGQLGVISISFGEAIATDVKLARAAVFDNFAVVDCLACGGLLKPDVVFFGENVPKGRVAECFAQVSASSALVVLGSSLTVMSGLRYIRHASSLGIPVLIVNQGTTRGDDLATARLDAPLGATLTALARELGLADDSLSVA